MLKSLFTSKKFLVALSGAVVAAIVHFFPGYEELAQQLVAIVMAYVVGQGIADLGKEAQKEK